MIRRPIGTAFIGLLMLTSSAAAQVASFRPVADHVYVIVPQTRTVVIHPDPRPRPVPVPQPAVQVTGVDAHVAIRDQASTTTLQISLSNPSNRRQEAELMLPVPVGAVVRMLDFQGAGQEPSFQVLPREEARRIYNDIVNRSKDPALLEFAGLNVIRSSVFPVEAGSTQKIKVIYENLLKADGDRVDYLLPRTEALDYRVPWRITMEVRSHRKISTVYSPSHPLTIERVDDKHVKATMPDAASHTPGSLRVSYLMTDNGLSASLFAYPDPKAGGGYFLLLAGVPPLPKDKAPADTIKRDVTIVIDRSGSMNGPKIKQVREAAMQVIAGLDAGEAFNIIVYNEAVESFSAQPVLKSDKTETAARKYLERMTARGGTNIHDALVEALRQKPGGDMLPIVLFLTDGLPTIGETSEKAIREMVKKGNPFKRRVFTFGVGVDVNTPLLEAIADTTRASSEFVLPDEDVELKVAAVFKRLTGPVLADPAINVLDPSGGPAMGRTSDLIPNRLPDLFDGDQLVMVGRYLGEQPLTFELKGNYLTKPRTFRFDFSLGNATTKNAFVPRLWASRKIALLIDAIRAMGADIGRPGAPMPANDPRFKELVDEIVKLSTEFGILTEYTAFLAREGTDLAAADALVRIEREVAGNLAARAVRSRSGYGSYNQEANLKQGKYQVYLNADNSFVQQDMTRAEFTTVQQVNDRAFYRRGNQWIDSRLINKSQKPDKVIKVGTPEYEQLMKTLAEQNRQGCAAFKEDVMIEVNSQACLLEVH